MKKWYFDNAYEKVFIFNNEQKAYVFYGSYVGLDIAKKDSEAKKIIKAESAFSLEEESPEEDSLDY